MQKGPFFSEKVLHMVQNS